VRVCVLEGEIVCAYVCVCVWVSFRPQVYTFVCVREKETESEYVCWSASSCA